MVERGAEEVAESRVVRIREPGGPEVLEIALVPRPRPGVGEVAVRVRASGVNRADLVQRRGGYPAPEGYPQDVPGLEFAGTVEAVGSGVSRAFEGAPVMGITGGGAYAERLVVPAATLVRIPGNLAPLEAGAIPEAFMTAYDAILVQGRLTAGDTLLVHAVGSGVGTAALQLARRVGARVVGTSRSAWKLERAEELGLDAPVLAADDAWPEAARAAVGARGADVILDLVGGRYLEANQRLLAERGRHLVVGIPSGARARIDLGLLMRHRASLVGTLLRVRSPEEKRALARTFERDVVPGFEDGSFRPIVERVYPAAEAAAAHAFVEANRNFGKVLLRW